MTGFFGWPRQVDSISGGWRLMVKRVDEDVSDLKECEWRAVKPGGLDTTLVFLSPGQCFETSGKECSAMVVFC